MNVRETGAALAELGYAVHRIGSDVKWPRGLKGWERRPAPTPQQARRELAGAVRLGVRTGGGLLVLDADRHGEVDGVANLRVLFGANGMALPEPTARTGGGGLHWYFRAEGETPRNTAGRLAPGVDTRGDGGQVVAPPSTHESGRCYEWTDGLPPPVAGLPEAPAGLLALLRRPPPAPPVRVEVRTEGGLFSDGGARLYWTKAASEALSEGTRNVRGNGLAFIIGRLHAAGRCNGPALLRELAGLLSKAGLDEREIADVCRLDETGGFRRGQGSPLFGKARS